MITAILLAAGESKRMGKQNKLLLPYQGKPMILHMLDQLTASQASEVLVVMGHEADVMFRLLENHSPYLVLNKDYQKGMTTSIQAGVKASSHHAKGYMICQSDLPLITTADYDLLIHAFNQKLPEDPRLILQPSFKGKKGNPVIFSSIYRNNILQHTNMEGCRQIVQANRTHLQTVSVDSGHFFQDIDTPEDYEGFIN